MPYFTYDTSVIISRKLVAPRAKTTSFLMSAVVLMGLSASARDNSQLKIYERLFRDYQRDDSLIVPNEDDWLLASKVLYWLTQGRRRVSKGRLPRLAPGVCWITTGLQVTRKYVGFDSRLEYPEPV